MTENKDKSSNEWVNKLFDILVRLLPDLNIEQRKNWAKLIFATLLYISILYSIVPLLEKLVFPGRDLSILALILLGLWEVVLKSYFQCQKVFDRDIFKDSS